MESEKGRGPTKESIEAAAWELWDWLGDGRSQTEPISLLKGVVADILATACPGLSAELLRGILESHPSASQRPASPCGSAEG